MKKITIIITLTTIIVILLMSSAYGWTYVKKTWGYEVTLDSGNKINVTNITFDRQSKNIKAIVIANKLSIQDAVQIQNITQGIQDQLDKKKNNYNITTIIQNK